jgi:hypothetical protein
MNAVKQLLAISFLSLGFSCTGQAQERKNFFDDPFMQVTSSIAACPAPKGPAIMEDEMRTQAYVRAQHGVSCHLSGRCRLPNSYLYDKEIIPRVATFIQRDGRFGNTSVWVLGPRRLVTLMGCVESKEQAQAMEQAVGLVDDVMGVINYLMVGIQDLPPYPLSEPGEK